MVKNVPEKSVSGEQEKALYTFNTGPLPDANAYSMRLTLEALNFQLTDM